MPNTREFNCPISGKPCNRLDCSELKTSVGDTACDLDTFTIAEKHAKTIRQQNLANITPDFYNKNILPDLEVISIKYKIKIKAVNDFFSHLLSDILEDDASNN